MHVQLTAFESDHFPLAIQGGGDLPMNTPEIAVGIENVSATKSKVSVSIGRGARLDRRSDEKMFRPNSSLIGANTLSIIGQIEPGRTVRLYRQIH